VSAPGGAVSGRVLLAEDNLINQRVAVAMLSSAGYQVDTVLDGAAAVEASAANDYDAILMDCQMPELSGYEATAAIRTREGTERHTPIIALTAGARREDRDRCLAEGMDSYLAKPVSKDALLALVARCVKHDRELGAPLSRIGHAADAETTIDTGVLDELRLIGEAADEDFIAELVDEFLRDTDVRLAALRTAIEAEDAAMVGEIAHSIKGGGAQLGGHRLAASCGRLETRAATGTLSGALVELREVELDYEELRYALNAQLTTAERDADDCDMTG
jgi:CheY-like chemotaxis protein/HPt (histidine-containing phosphotransfer) domain-containing protein